MEYQGFVNIFGGYRYCNKTDESARKHPFETCFYLLPILIWDKVSFALVLQGLQSTVHRTTVLYVFLSEAYVAPSPSPLPFFTVWGGGYFISSVS
jgi:hypothetical protein